MHFYYLFLLLLVVLSAYSGGSHHVKSPDSLDPTSVAVCTNSNSAQLGILAPVLPHNEVYKTTLPQNEVYKIALPQNEAELNKTVLPQIRVFKIDAANCQLFDMVKTIKNFVSNLGVKNFNNLSSALIHGGKKLGWTVRILLEALQHILKMYTWSLAESQASIQFRCRLAGLFLKQSCFRKNDFDISVYRIYRDYQNVCSQHLKLFQNIEMMLMHISKKNILRNQPDINFMVVVKHFCFHLMNFFHIH
jgi:hypothetical protein